MDPTDYQLSDADAMTLRVAVLLPAEERRLILTRYQKQHGPDRLVELFAQMIGLANSVIANNRESIEIAGIVSGALFPGREHQINLPTLFGALGGLVLANSVDQAKTCAGCAFRQGSPANQCPPTVIDAEWCLNPGEDDFLCHEDLDGGEPRHPCRGYAQHLRAKRAAENEP